MFIGTHVNTDFFFSLSDGLLSEAQSAHWYAGKEEQGEEGARGEWWRAAVRAGGRSPAQLLQQLLEQE